VSARCFSGNKLDAHRPSSGATLDRAYDLCRINERSTGRRVTQRCRLYRLGALQTGWVFGSTSRNGVIKANQSGASLFPHFIHLQLERGRISGFVESIVRA